MQVLSFGDGSSIEKAMVETMKARTTFLAAGTISGTVSLVDLALRLPSRNKVKGTASLDFRLILCCSWAVVMPPSR